MLPRALKTQLPNTTAVNDKEEQIRYEAVSIGSITALKYVLISFTVFPTLLLRLRVPRSSKKLRTL